MRRQRSNTYRILARFFRNTYPELADRLAAAAAREAAISLALTDSAGRVYVRRPGAEPLPIPETHEQA
jgi:hypothetical protein